VAYLLRIVQILEVCECDAFRDYSLIFFNNLIITIMRAWSKFIMDFIRFLELLAMTIRLLCTTATKMDVIIKLGSGIPFKNCTNLGGM
jgi:hypothetical protein